MSKQTFNFVGELLIPRDAENFYKSWHKTDDRGRTKARNSIKFGVKEGGRNVGYVTLTGFEMDDIRTYDTEGNQLIIDWADRMQPEVARNVSFSRRYKVNLGKDYDEQTFVTQYDMVEYLADVLPNYPDMVRVTGTWEKNPYKGRISDRFVIQNVYGVTPDTVPKLELTMEAFYNGDCVNTQKSDGKIYLDCYIRQYLGQNGYVFFHQNAILCNTAYEFESEVRTDDFVVRNVNPKHVALWEFKKSFLEGLSKKKMYRMAWNCRYINGAEEVSFDESMLTATQKAAIEVGLATLDDYKPKGDLYGSKIQEVRLASPKLTGDYAEGVVECDEKVDDILSQVFSFEEEESLEAAVAKEEKAVEKTVTIPEDEDDLF